MRFHVENGGVSRYRKFEHLLTAILGHATNEVEVKVLTDAYGECVYRELLQCDMTAKLHELREAMTGQAWMVVSGGDEQELRRVFCSSRPGQAFRPWHIRQPCYKGRDL